MSVCTNETHHYRDTVRNCTIALSIVPTATEALYLRSVARLGLNELYEAMVDIEAVYKQDPSYPGLRAHFEVI